MVRSSLLKYLFPVVASLVILLAFGVGSARPKAEATVSGRITHDGIPVEGVQVNIGWDDSGTGMVTDSDGIYSFSGIQTQIYIHIHVQPPLEMRLAFRDWGCFLSGDLTKDFAMEEGYLLEGVVTYPDGSVYEKNFGFNVSELMTNPPDGEWLSVAVDEGSFATVLPPGVYTLLSSRPIPYYMPFTKVDLRIGDLSGLKVQLLDGLPEPFPTTPPIAELISVGPANIDGIATVSGATGAVSPLSSVLIVNLDAETVITTTSQSDGSFEASLFAPPGSSISIKYDPAGDRVKEIWSHSKLWDEAGDFSIVNPLPGTLLTVGDPPVGNGQSQEFNAAGRYTGKGWAGWWTEGVLEVSSNGDTPGLAQQPGEPITITLDLFVTSPAMQCSGIPTATVNVDFHLQYLFNGQGQAEPWGMWFDSFISTPTGLPIERESGGLSRGIGGFPLSGLVCLSEHTLVGHVDFSTIMPVDLPTGIYRPIMIVSGDVPRAMDFLFVDVWYSEASFAEMPLFRSGQVATVRIPWILLGDYPVNGLRGLVAHQDEGNYNLVTRVIYPSDMMIIPRIVERLGVPLVYRLDPASNWLSSTDRRMAPAPHIKLDLPSGEMMLEILKPDGSVDVLGPAPILQASIRTPTLPDGTQISEGTGQIGDLFHLTTLDSVFNYIFEQYGKHTIYLFGSVEDIYGNSYSLESTYEVMVARVLDLDPAQLPTTPYMQGDAFAPGLHIFPPLPAEVNIQVMHLPYSDPNQAVLFNIEGQANLYGYFQPPAGTEFHFETPGEFRVDIIASYQDPDGTLWAGTMTWGNVVEGEDAQIEAHGRRGMDYHGDVNYEMPAWFANNELPPELIGIENYYPYFNGDIHWGTESIGPGKGDSIHSIITFRDLRGGDFYDILRNYFGRATSCYRWPPDECSPEGLDARIAVGEAPLFITTDSGIDPEVDPSQIDLWGYWYGSSERPDVHVREIISEDNMGTAYWRFNDTYGYQIGEPSTGDQPGDIKWEFGGVVLRVPEQEIHQYAIYSSLWVLLPYDDAVGARVTAPFQDAVGAGINGGPIMNLLGEEIDVLFLPKGVRPGDILYEGDTVSFSGHVGPPLNSRVEVRITSPSGIIHQRVWQANKIGWIYDPTFDFVANEAGRWTVDVFVEHDQPYLPTGVIPQSHNTGTVLGTDGQYEFYVVEKDAGRLHISDPSPGFLIWNNGGIEPIHIQGHVPVGTELVHYTIHDKGIVMRQGSSIPDSFGNFTITYDAEALFTDFPMLSLTAHEGRWEGLADEVSIHLLAVGGEQPQVASVTLIGEEIFIQAASSAGNSIFLPLTSK